MRRFLPAVLLALANLALAPFLGLLRDWLFDTFPGAAVRVVVVTLGVLGVGILLVALARIREGRVWRYALLAVVAGLVLLQTLVLNRGNLRVDVVEKVHFVQYGLLAFLVYRGLRKGPGAAPVDFSLLLLPVLWGGIAGILEEWVQWLVPVRTGEVLDVALNSYAAFCGTLLAVALVPPWKTPGAPGLPVGILARPSPARRRALLRSVALGVLLLAGFYHSAHLGYWVEYKVDGQVGGFRSWFTGAELLAAKADRARRWATAPPRRVPLAVEDRYVSESGWHIHGRNAAWERRDWATVWHESRILEHFYAPFLEVPPLPGTANYRLPPEQMRQVEEGFESLSTVPSDRESGGHTSRVLEDRITLWRGGKGTFWAAALGLAALLLLGGERLERRQGLRGGKDGSSGGT